LLGFAGVRAGVPPVVLRWSLYTIYSTCLPPYNVVRPGASSHCERRPRHLRLCVCRLCCACMLPAFPSDVRGMRECVLDFQRGLRGVCGALSHDCTRVPRGMRCASRAHAPRAASPRATIVQACSCARSGGRRVLRATQHTLPTPGFFFTDVEWFSNAPDALVIAVMAPFASCAVQRA
jgi:hypothetical protein